MLCGFKIKPTHGKKKLLLSRQGQESLFHWLWKTTQDHSFVFNTTQGLYLFLPKEHCTESMEKWLDNYLQGNISEDYILYNCSWEDDIEVCREDGSVLGSLLRPIKFWANSS